VRLPSSENDALVCPHGAVDHAASKAEPGHAFLKPMGIHRGRVKKRGVLRYWELLGGVLADLPVLRK